jgi:TPR repeat protein
MMHVQGDTVPLDDDEANRWFRRAADQGYSVAQFNLGYRYATGEGAQQNVVKAARWFRKAALQGSSDAQLLLGAAYIKGDGVQRDVVEAHMWIALSAEAGNANARDLLSRLDKQMPGSHVARARRLKAEWHESHM